MFRRKNGNHSGILGSGGGSDAGLPMTGLGNRHSRNNLLNVILSWFEKTPPGTVDGSAGSIHVTPTAVQSWQRASVPVKFTYITFFTTIFMVWFGWRYIRYYNSGINLNCHATGCTLKLTHVGWTKPTTVELGRHQVVRADPVKVKKDGTFVSGNASVKIDYRKDKKGKSTLNYKGPDEDGNYLSYAIYFKDGITEEERKMRKLKARKDAAQRKVSGDPNANATMREKNDDEMDELLDQEFDISAIHPYTTPEDPGIRRLVVRQQIPYMGHSKRRVRTMVNKLDSYIRKRRQKVLIRENISPAWQGVILMVLGSVVFILTCLLGQFRDDSPISGPGARRHRQQQMHPQTEKTKMEDALRSQTPARYEVATQPVGNSSDFRSHATSATSRRRGT